MPLDQPVVPSSAAQPVDQLMISNSMHPWNERTRWVPCAALQMNAEQGFLHDIFHIGKVAADPSPNPRPHERRDGAQRHL